MKTLLFNPSPGGSSEGRGWDLQVLKTDLHTGNKVGP